MKFPKFNRNKRKDDPLYNAQLADLERYQSKDLTKTELIRLQDREFGAKVTDVNGKPLKRMSRKEFLRLAGITGLLSAGAAIMSKVPVAHAPSAPSTGWNLDSGSMVIPMTSCVYVDPSGPTYLSRNGLTGSNDFSEVNAQTLLGTDVFPNLPNNKGAWVHCKAGDYPLGTVTPAIVLGRGNLMVSGEGGNPDYSLAPDIISSPATRLINGVNNQTIIRGTTAGILNLLGVVVRDIDFETGGFTGGVCVDLSATTNLSSAGTKLERLYFNNILNDRLTYSGSFATGIILDGAADTVVEQCTDGLSRTGGTSTVCTNADLSFVHPSGGLTVKDCILISSVSIQGVWQTLKVLKGSYAQFKLSQAPGGGPNFTNVEDCYLGPSTSSPGDLFNVNGFAADLFDVRRSWIRPGKNTGGAATRVIFLNGGTLDNLIIQGCQIDKFSTNTISITDNSANCGRRRVFGQGTRTTGAFTSLAPFTVDANGFINSPALVP